MPDAYATWVTSTVAEETTDSAPVRTSVSVLDAQAHPLAMANFRAIAVTIGGSDDVAEGSTVVWSPNGKTFDVCAAFVVSTSNFRVMRMRLYGSGTTLTPTVVDGQNADGYTSSTTYLHGVVWLV